MTVRSAGLAFVGLLVAACTGAPADTAPAATVEAPATASPAPTPRPSPTLPAGVSLVVPIGEAVYGIAAAPDTIWAEAHERLLQLDAATGEQLQVLDGGWAPAAARDSLWYLRGQEVVEADLRTGAQRAAYTPPHLGTKVDERGVLWATDEATSTLYAIDLGANEILHALQLPPGEPKWVEPWEGAIWVVIDGPEGGALRVDPETGQPIGEILEAGARPHSVATGFGSLWVIDHGSANVFRFAPDGTLEATIPGPGWNVAIAATEDAIWAAGTTAIMAIDPATNTIGRKVEIGMGDWYGLAYAGGYLWLTTAEGKRLLQLPASDERPTTSSVGTS
jgi:streptogramin lyase